MSELWTEEQMLAFERDVNEAFARLMDEQILGGGDRVMAPLPGESLRIDIVLTRTPDGILKMERADGSK